MVNGWYYMTYAVSFVKGDMFICVIGNKDVQNQPVFDVFYKLCDAELSMKLRKCHFFTKEIQYFGHDLSTTGIKPLPFQNSTYQTGETSKNAKQVKAFFAQIAKPLIALTPHDAKFNWTSGHYVAFNTLKGAFIEAPILHYPGSSKCHIVYTDASDDSCKGIIWLAGSPSVSGAVTRRCWLQFISDLFIF